MRHSTSRAGTFTDRVRGKTGQSRPGRAGFADGSLLSFDGSAEAQRQRWRNPSVLTIITTPAFQALSRLAVDCPRRHDQLYLGPSIHLPVGHDPFPAECAVSRPGSRAALDRWKKEDRAIFKSIAIYLTAALPCQ